MIWSKSTLSFTCITIIETYHIIASCLPCCDYSRRDDTTDDVHLYGVRTATSATTKGSSNFESVAVEDIHPAI